LEIAYLKTPLAYLWLARDFRMQEAAFGHVPLLINGPLIDVCSLLHQSLQGLRFASIFIAAWAQWEFNFAATEDET
jgi:hypothetical protein